MSKLTRILCLDGGGAKGMYTLGVLTELEEEIGQPICHCFDLIYGTSTGAIIGALLALGDTVSTILNAYQKDVPTALGHRRAAKRSSALSQLGARYLASRGYADLQTRLGIVTADCTYKRPRLFKSHSDMAIVSLKSFKPGHGLPLLDAVVASASAVPYFNPVSVEVPKEGIVKLIDGGFVANNPTMFAITDAMGSMKTPVPNLRVISIGTGGFQEDEGDIISKGWSRIMSLTPVPLINAAFEANSKSIDLMIDQLVPSIKKERVATSHANVVCGMLTTDKQRLQQAFACGREAFRGHKSKLVGLLTE